MSQKHLHHHGVRKEKCQNPVFSEPAEFSNNLPMLIGTCEVVRDHTTLSPDTLPDCGSSTVTQLEECWIPVSVLAVSITSTCLTLAMFC